MKASRCLPVALAVLACAAPALGQAHGPRQSADASPATLTDDLPVPVSIRQVLDHPSLNGAKVGLVVADAETGELVLSRNGEELFAPASVNKLFTTAAAARGFCDMAAMADMIGRSDGIRLHRQYRRAE